MRRVLLIGLWVLFVGMLLQLSGWIYFSLGIAKSIEGYGYPTGLHVPHDELGYAYQPGFSGLFNGSSYRDVPIEINAEGFRDAPFEPVAADRARIALLGDSVVFGAGVRADQRFSECLESGNGESTTVAGTHAPQILNLGVSGYSFGHYLVLTETLLSDLAPTAELVGLTLNDFALMQNARMKREMQERAQGSHWLDWLQLAKERIAGVYAIRFLEELGTRVRYALLNADKREAYHTKWMRSVAAAWAVPETATGFAADLDRLIATAAAQKLPLGFLPFPELNDLLDPAQFSGPRQTLLGLLRERDLRVCDPYAAFAQQPEPQRLFLSHDDVHFSPAGHVLLCEVVRGCLDDWGFLAP